MRLCELMRRKTCPPAELRDLCQWSHFSVPEENYNDFVSFVLEKFDELGIEGRFSEVRFHSSNPASSERVATQCHHAQETANIVINDALRKIYLGNAGEILLYLTLVHWDNLTCENLKYAWGVNVSSIERRISNPGIDILVCIFHEQNPSEDRLFIYEVKTTGEPNGDIQLSAVRNFFVCRLNPNYLREQLLPRKVYLEDIGRHGLGLRLMKFALQWGKRNNSIVICPAFVIDAENQIQRFTNRLQDFCNDDRLSGRPIILNFVQIRNVRCILEQCYDRLVQPRL